MGSFRCRVVEPWRSVGYVRETARVRIEEDLIEDCTRIIDEDPRCELIDINLDSLGNGIRIDININVLPFNKQATMQLDFERETL